MCCSTARSTSGGRIAPFADTAENWSGEIVNTPTPFVTAIGAGTTYPDYKPAPFIVSSQVEGVDMVTVVTEGIYSYCGVKLKIDTDRHLGAECAIVRARGRAGRARHDGRIWLADALARRRQSSHPRRQEGGPRHLRDSARSLQRQAGRTDRRRRRQRDRRGGQGAHHQRQARAAHARRLRLGDDRHVRQTMARQGRRSRRRRRSHHGRVSPSIRPASCSARAIPASR